MCDRNTRNSVLPRNRDLVLVHRVEQVYAELNVKHQLCFIELGPWWGEDGIDDAIGDVHMHVRCDPFLGGAPTLENCQCICKACDAVKTNGGDLPQIAKAKRQQANHLGARPPSRNPLPGSRGSKYKPPNEGDRTNVETGK